MLAFFFTVWCSDTGRAFAQADPYALDVGLRNNGMYAPDAWITVRASLTNRTNKDANGSLQLDVPSRVEGDARFRTPVFVPANSTVQADFYGHFPPLPTKSTRKEPQPDSRLGTANWSDAGGGRLARTEVLARPSNQPLTERSDNSMNGSSLMLLQTARQTNQPGGGDAYDAGGLGRFLSNSFGVIAQTDAVETARLPRHQAGYDSYRYLFADGLAPDLLDPAQRSALLAWVRAGGILVLTAPPDDADPSDSWLAPYLPVQIVGHRLADRLNGPRGRFMKFTDFLLITEATALPPAGNVHVTLHDDAFVQAAYTDVGLGRIAFTSFPASSLDVNDDWTRQIWSTVLDVSGRGRPTWRTSGLELKRDAIMQSMAGLPAPRWAVAAAVSGTYLLLVMGSQFWWGGARRPTAFAAIIGLAVVVSGGLVGVATLRHRDQPLAAARLVTIDVAADGGGLRQEAVVFVGQERPNLSLAAASGDATMRPARAGGETPTVENPPFSIPDAAAHEARLDLAWQLTAPVSGRNSVSAVAQFTASGLQLDANNQTGQPLHQPLLLWGKAGFRTADLNPGSPAVPVPASDRNPPGDFTNNSGVFASDFGKVRGEILRAAVTPPPDAVATIDGTFDTEPEVELAGWLDDAAVPPLARISAGAAPAYRTQALLRTPVAIRPSDIGSTIRIEPAFTRIVVHGSDSAGIPFDLNRQEWIARVRQDGDWLIGFAAPRAVGRLRPTVATLVADIDVAQQVVTVRRGQCADGAVRRNIGGPAIATWRQTFGRQSAVSFNCEPLDIDANGVVWVLLSVSVPASQGNASEVSGWSFREMSIGYDAAVLGPPVVVTAEVPPPPAPKNEAPVVATNKVKKAATTKKAKR